MTIGNPNHAGSWQGITGQPLEHQGVAGLAGGLPAGLDPVEAYFECITSCSLDDGECITTCTTILREHH
jgi:hypothetical protein